MTRGVKDRGTLCFGEMIRILREKRGLSQRDLAARRGVPQSTVAEHELAVKGVGEYTLIQYAYALDYKDLLAFLEAGTRALRETSPRQK